jgi:hypothetical protein
LAVAAATGTFFFAAVVARTLGFDGVALPFNDLALPADGLRFVVGITGLV